MCVHKAADAAPAGTVSPIRKTYIARLVGRCVILLWSVMLWKSSREIFGILDGMAFFDRFSVLHLLWLIWILDMLGQLLPMRHSISLGSQKYMSFRFQPAKRGADLAELRRYTAAVSKKAALVFALWTCLTGTIDALFFKGILGKVELFLVSVFFYVCDLICVLIWCPFRLMLGNRCCTTCRIFNWDHLMMFSPLIFVGGFFALTLVALAVVVFVLWELSVWKHPERFWEQTNGALKCAACTDKLCTQYCGKHRR